MILTIVGANFEGANIGQNKNVTITLNKTGANGSKSSVTLKKGESVSSNTVIATGLSAASGYENLVVTVTMAGKDVSHWFSNANGTVTIPSETPITGNIIIKATASKIATGGGEVVDPEEPGSGGNTGGTVINLFTLNDSETLDALFKDGIYRGANGLGASESFDEKYPASDKIYINGNEGTYTLPLESGKTYRWKCVPYFEWGNIKMDAPWGNGTNPFKNTDGKSFWFFDADDALIANNKTAGSNDDCTLMTIPEGAVYMRFMTMDYETYPDKTKVVLMNRLMVTEGTDIYEEYIAPLK